MAIKIINGQCIILEIQILHLTWYFKTIFVFKMLKNKLILI